MDSKRSSEEQVLLAVQNWFRIAARKEKLEAHEERLFQAVIEWQYQGKFPGPPKNPELSKLLDYLPPATSSTSGTRPKVNQDDIPTQPPPKYATTEPAPPKVQEQLRKESQNNFEAVPNPKRSKAS